MKVMIALAITGLAIAPLSAKPAQCRDTKGHFAKCSSPTSVPATPAAVLAEKPAVVDVDKNGKCHVSAGPKKGQFTTCPKK